MVLARNGKVFERVLREQLVSSADFHKARRQHALADVSEVALALLETNGSISIVPRAGDGGERAAQYLAYLDGAVPPSASPASMPSPVASMRSPPASPSTRASSTALHPMPAASASPFPKLLPRPRTQPASFGQGRDGARISS